MPGRVRRDRKLTRGWGVRERGKPIARPGPGAARSSPTLLLKLLIYDLVSNQARTIPGLRRDCTSCRKCAALLTTDWAQVCQARLVPLVVLRRVVCNRVRRLRTGLIQRCDDRFALRAAFLPTRLLAFGVLAGKVYTVVVHHAETPRAHGKGRETCQICAPCREKSRAHGTSSMPKVVPARQGRAARAPPTLTIPNQTTQQKSGLLGIPE